MSNDDTINVTLTGSVDGLQAALQQGEAEVNKSTGGIVSAFAKMSEGTQEKVDSTQKSVKGAMSGITEAFEAVSAPLMAITAIVGGGAFFKEAIGVTNKLNGEAIKLSKTLGITAEEAATLRTALGDIYSDVDTYTGAFQKFAGQLRRNEQGLRDMGLETRDANGHLRDSNQLFEKALRAVGEYKPGLDQTTAAMTYFGKSVDDVMTLQKLNSKVLDEAREKNEALGMTMTKEGVQATKEYKAAMNDVGDVLEAVKNTIGKAVMPVFTELAKYFAESGPYVVNVFKGALTGLLVAFRYVQGAVQTIAAVIFEFFNTVIEGAGLFGQVFSKLMDGDFAGAAESAKALGTRVGQGFKNAFHEFVDIGDEVDKKIKGDISRVWDKGTEVEAPKSGTKQMGEFKTGNEKPRTNEWEADLTAKKAAIVRQGLEEGQLREMSKADELKYWQDLKEKGGMTREEMAAVSRKVSEAEMAMVKNKFEVEIAALNAQEAAYKNNMAAKIAIEEQIQAKYQQGTKEYEDAQKRIVQIQRQAAEQQKQIADVKDKALMQAQLNQVALEENAAQTQLNLGAMTQDQMLQMQVGFENRRFAISANALQGRLALLELDPDHNPVELARIHAELEALEQQHQLKIAQIQGQIKQNDLTPLTNTMQVAENSFNQHINAMLNRTESLRTALKNIWADISKSIISEIVKVLVKRAAAWATERALTLAGIGADAAKAGSGAASSVASIPYVGPILAIAALASVLGAVSATSSKVPSAAGGFDIPRGMNPVTQLHEEEMVLPKGIANPLRDALAEGGGLGGGGGDTHHWNVQAIDPRGFQDFLMKRGGADVLVKALNERRRNGGLS